MRWLSLYSGAGFHDHGIRMAGNEIVGQIEWDAFCTEVLKKNFGDLPRWSDVRDATVQSIRERCGRIDCITGGFSCKNISVAGKQAGIARQTESGITWRNMFRIIRGIRPAWIVVENVSALRTIAADRVLAALERIGYARTPAVVGAEHVGAPHRRHRVWIVGRLENAAMCGWDYASSQDSGIGDERLRKGGPSIAEQIRGTVIADGIKQLADDPRQQREQRAEQNGPWPSGEHRCFFPGGCWRCANMADTSGEGLEERRDSAISAGSQQSMLAGGGGLRWPSRPGERQHDWESPRLVKPSLGEPVAGNARRLVRPTAANARAVMAGTEAGGMFDAYQRKEGLKAAGNANPPWTPYLIARWILNG